MTSRTSRTLRGRWIFAAIAAASALAGLPGAAFAEPPPVLVAKPMSPTVRPDILPPVDSVFSMDWFTMDGGGGVSTFGGPTGFILEGTIGQPDAGPLVGGGFELAGGYWTPLAAPEPCCVDYNNDEEIDFSDIEFFLAAYAAQIPGSCAPGADWNGDEEFDFSDIEFFIAAYSAGC